MLPSSHNARRWVQLLPILLLSGMAGLGIVLIGAGWAGAQAPVAARTVDPAQGTATATATPACTPVWALVNSPNPGMTNHLEGISAINGQDIWSVGDYIVAQPTPYKTYNSLTTHWDGYSWTQVPSPFHYKLPIYLYDVAARATDDVWAVGVVRDRSYDIILHWDGSEWNNRQWQDSVATHRSQDNEFSAEVPNSYTALYGVDALSANDVWAVGHIYSTTTSLIYHRDVNGWRHISGNPEVGRLNAVAAVATNDVWTVGEGGILHWNGSTWQQVPSPDPQGGFTDIAVVSANDIWAVGNIGWDQKQPVIRHWNGTAWTSVAAPGPGLLRAVAARNSSDVWAVGVTADQPYTIHWDGSAWSVVPTGSLGMLAWLEDVAIAGNEVWAVGRRQDGQSVTARYGLPCATPLPSATVIGTPTNTGTPTITATPTVTMTPCGSFSDVSPTDYFYTAVQYLAGQGVISGYTDCTFRPYNNATRGQMVKIVVAGFNIPTTTPTASGYTFSDVLPGNTFFSFVETAAAAGIVAGYPCGDAGEPCDAQNRPYFRLYTNVTRGQLSKIVVVGAGWTQVTPEQGTFSDVLPGSSFYSFIETAYCRGIITGYSCGGPGEPCDSRNRPYFRPGNNAVRGQIAKIVYGALTTTQSCVP